jgi:hypothetical protein
MRHTDVLVTGQFETVQQMVQQLFWQQGFNVVWQDGYNGKATKGDKGMNVIGGAFAQYYEIDFQIFSSPETGMGVRVFKSNIGGWGGVAGVAMVGEEYDNIINFLTNYFQTYGMFRGKQED